MATLNIDTTNIQPNTAFDPMPAGWYTAQIVESELKKTTDQTGEYLAVTMEIMSGNFSKRKLFDRFNLTNKNPQAVEIAYRQLSALSHATGVLQIGDSQELHGKPFDVKITITPASTDGKTGKAYDAKNEVRGYRACEAIASGGATAAPAWAKPPAATPAPAAFALPVATVAATAAVPPWLAKK
jgi:Protein of unknown function (DUF669)